jgi:hypothetical protein
MFSRNSTFSHCTTSLFFSFGTFVHISPETTAQITYNYTGIKQKAQEIPPKRY